MLKSSVNDFGRGNWCWGHRRWKRGWWVCLCKVFSQKPIRCLTFQIYYKFLIIVAKHSSSWKFILNHVLHLLTIIVNFVYLKGICGYVIWMPVHVHVHIVHTNIQKEIVPYKHQTTPKEPQCQYYTNIDHNFSKISFSTVKPNSCLHYASAPRVVQCRFCTSIR